MKRWLSSGLRLAMTLALLGMLAWQLNTGQLLERLSALSPGWVLLAMLIGVPQVMLSAWRWRMTAHQIGVRLRWPTAIREYYLATFLNQVLPGGVMGDAARAWRHGNAQQLPGNASTHRPGPAIRAVVIERASGQVALLLVAIVAVIASPALRGSIARLWTSHTATGSWAALIGLLLMAGIIGLCRNRQWDPLAQFLGDIKRALLAVKVWPAQLISSLLVVTTYIAVFLCAAQALNLQRPIMELLPLIPPLLMAMAVPLTVAGWGLREGAAAMIWPLAGLPAQEGVTLSVTYGLLILAASLPGLAVLMLDRRVSRQPSRRTSSTSRKTPLSRKKNSARKKVAPGGQPG